MSIGLTCKKYKVNLSDEEKDIINRFKAKYEDNPRGVNFCDNLTCMESLIGNYDVSILDINRLCNLLRTYNSSIGNIGINSLVHNMCTFIQENEVNWAKDYDMIKTRELSSKKLNGMDIFDLNLIPKSNKEVIKDSVITCGLNDIDRKN